MTVHVGVVLAFLIVAFLAGVVVGVCVGRDSS
jgi:hypothetical protein